VVSTGNRFRVALLIVFITEIAGFGLAADYNWCGDQDIFFRNDSSDVSGYFVMDHLPEIAPTAYKHVSVSSETGSQQIGAWITPAGSPGTQTIAPGLWRFRTYLNVSSATGATNYEYKVFNRSSDGTETDLFYGHVISVDINDLTPTEHLISYARRNWTTLFPGDRLVIKINASTSSVAARDAWIAVSGNNYASMVSASYFVCDISGGGMVANELPVSIPIIIAAVAGSIGLISWRRKNRM
jgi:hypothetical protein